MAQLTMGGNNWKRIDITLALDPEPAMEIAASVYYELDPTHFTERPSESPSLSPSRKMTPIPSPGLTYSPSFSPSAIPTLAPSKSFDPTTRPTRAPSTMAPSAAPLLTTSAPTEPKTTAPTAAPIFYHENLPPADPPTTYFNYDPESPSGPGRPILVPHNATHDKFEYVGNGWADVNYTDPMDNYWHEFDYDGFGYMKGLLGKRYPSINKCGTVGHQSPINVRSTGFKCKEGHQIRHRRGDWKIDDAQIKKQILPNKLRLLYDRRPGRASEPDPPHADFPNGWGTYADAIHVDVKIPSEHLIEGRRYVAEYQIFHLHHAKTRAPVISIMVDANETSPTNDHFQLALDQWQLVFDSDLEECRREAGPQRRDQASGRKNTDAKAGIDFPAVKWEADEHRIDKVDSHYKNRKLQRQQGKDQAINKDAWDPYHESILRGIYFWGYDGSTTDPPCGEFVAWRVHDTPMIISLQQLSQMKNLLFNHVNGNCERTSVHYKGSVARPIQDIVDRPVWRCTRDDFLSDEEAGLVWFNDKDLVAATTTIP